MEFRKPFKMKSDLLLSLLLIGSGLISAYAYWHFSDDQSNSFSDATTLGSLDSGTNPPRYRSGESVIWQDMNHQEIKTIKAGDAVFTQSQSNVNVKLKTGNEVSIEPNSLVIFKSPPVGMVSEIPLISIEKGSVKVHRKVAKSTPLPVLIESHGKVYQVEVPHEEKSATIAAEEKAPSITLESGKAVEPIAVKTVVASAVTVGTYESKISEVKPEASVAETEKPAEQPVEEIVYKKAAVLPEVQKPAVRAIASEPAVESPKVEEKVKAAEAQPEERGALYEIVPGFFSTTLFSMVPGSNREAQVQSQMHFSVTGNYLQNWSKNVRTYLQLSLGYISFEDATDSSISISGKSKFTTGLGFGGDFQLNPNFSLSFLLSDQKQLFIKSLTTNVISIDAIMVPSFDLKLSQHLFEVKTYAAGFSLMGSALAPTKTDSYSTRFGYGLGGGLYVRHRNRQTQETRFQAELGFIRRKQDTTFFDQSENKLFLQFRFPMGEE